MHGVRSRSAIRGALIARRATSTCWIYLEWVAPVAGIRTHCRTFGCTRPPGGRPKPRRPAYAQLALPRPRKTPPLPETPCIPAPRAHR
ncbi:MAG: hypothetical protein E2579_00140 [Pseudomonas sp.]|nr:hypothetical protein [Pseudomonas sp.]WJH55757.1 hypothetical protein FE254_06120 [Pseudomonas guguanensis]